MEDQAKAVARIVREDDELQARMEAEAKATARALIQRYLGPTIQGPGARGQRLGYIPVRWLRT